MLIEIAGSRPVGIHIRYFWTKNSKYGSLHLHRFHVCRNFEVSHNSCQLIMLRILSSLRVRIPHLWYEFFTVFFAPKLPYFPYKNRHSSVDYALDFARKWVRVRILCIWADFCPISYSLTRVLVAQLVMFYTIGGAGSIPGPVAWII